VKWRRDRLVHGAGGRFVLGVHLEGVYWSLQNQEEQASKKSSLKKRVSCDSRWIFLLK
jgi:hypothetical protein